MITIWGSFNTKAVLPRNMARVELVFDVEKDLPEFLSSVLDRTEDYIRSNETNIKDFQVQFVVLDRTVSLLNSY